MNLYCSLTICQYTKSILFIYVNSPYTHLCVPWNIPKGIFVEIETFLKYISKIKNQE